ncbi:hypothetical protein B566_EDAN008035 [Ephemera danica]|nr:hypothetical protein B566_EDAN008035 [Ephemera danica]
MSVDELAQPVGGWNNAPELSRHLAFSQNFILYGTTRYETVSCLLNFPECDINLTDNEGNTAFHLAVGCCYEAKADDDDDDKILPLFIQRDVLQLNVQNEMGQTALNLAAIRLGADVNIKDNDNRTPLELARWLAADMKNDYNCKCTKLEGENRGGKNIIENEHPNNLKNRTIDANILYKTLCEEIKHVIQRDEVPFITEHTFALLLVSSFSDSTVGLLLDDPIFTGNSESRKILGAFCDFNNSHLFIRSYDPPPPSSSLSQLPFRHLYEQTTTILIPNIFIVHSFTSLFCLPKEFFVVLGQLFVDLLHLGTRMEVPRGNELGSVQLQPGKIRGSEGNGKSNMARTEKKKKTAR